MFRTSGVCAFVLLATACSGNIEAGPRAGADGRRGAGAGGAAGASSAGLGGAAGAAGGSGHAAPPGNMLLPSATLRRLTPAQYRNSVRELLGIELDVSALTAIPPLSGLQAIGAATVAFAEVDLEAFERLANDAAATVFNDESSRLRVVGCDASSAACAEGFVRSFGRRAFRRPLDAGEATRYEQLRQTATTMTGSAWLGLRVVTSALLQSPNFLYREELGTPGAGGEPVRTLTDYQLASRIAFFLTNSAPDAALLDAVEAGALATPKSTRSQAEQLLANATEAVSHDLLQDYLRLDGLDSLVKLPDLFPAATPELAQAMKQETLLSLRQRLFDTSSDFRTVFTSTTTFVNGELAELYDVPAPRGDALVQIELPASGPRAGLLTQASFLALHAHPGRTSPTRRGKFIRENFLCQAVPAPPPNVDTSLPDTSDARTLREKLTEHRENPACAGCHTLMDPIGLPLEHFDALGEFRQTENGAEIDASGELDGATFQDARGLGVALSEHPAVTSCFTRTLLRYARGALETASEGERIAALEAAFASAGYRVPALMLEIASDPEFRTVGELP